MILHQKGGGVHRRTPLRTYKPDNAPHITACVTYSDPVLGIVAHSIRSSLGIMRASTAIHFDAGVYDRLVADGCQWLECHIKDTDTTYRAHVDTMIKHGQLQHRYGLQRVLSLRYWNVDGEEPRATALTTASDEPIQGALFDLLAGQRHKVVYS